MESVIERTVILERPTMLMRANYTALVTVMLRGAKGTCRLLKGPSCLFILICD